MRGRKKARGKGCCARIMGVVACVLLALAIVMFVNANIVRLTYTDVVLKDLPEAFDGKTILFVTDIHTDSFNTANRVAKLFDTLQMLCPDLLLLGGDYASSDVTTMLHALVTGQNAQDVQKRRNRELFDALKGFYAPLGKFAVAGNHDKEDETLEESMRAGDVTLLRNRGVRLPMAEGALTLVGLDDWTTGVQNVRGMAQMVKARECVIVVSHDPRAFADAVGRKSADGKGWFDCMLAGHTHGGQVMPEGMRWLPELVIGEMPYVSGWYAQNGALLLVSNGIGTSFLPLRFGAAPDAQFLTLRRT